MGLVASIADHFRGGLKFADHFRGGLKFAEFSKKVSLKGRHYWLLEDV
jgi:hypothetical protein